MTNFY